MSTFDATKVIQNRPWFERAIEAVAPNYALKRLEARVQRELFSYNASQASRIYAPKSYGQPSESTQTSRSRVVMMWEARDLVENFPEAREISRKFGNYLTPTEYSPTTGNREYNGMVSEYFHEWCKRCDITSRHSFKKLVQIAAEERPVDGDCGIAIRRIDGKLRLQLVPATRIGNPNALGAESDHYFQGVIVDDMMQPIAYRVYRVTREGVYFGAEDIAAANFCHYFDPFRSDQMRGITDFHACMRTARMLYEILEAEKTGVRFASQQAALIYTDRGSANPRNLFQPTPAATLPTGQNQDNEFSEVGSIRYFGTADRIEVMPSRPSTAFTGFVQHLMHEISIGIGIPQGVLFGTQDYKGPAVRAEFAAADRFFAKHQGLLQDKVLDPIKNAVILDAIANGEIPPPPMEDGETAVQALRRACRGEWRFPAKLTIDIGRESAANMNENRQGAKSLQEIAAEQGTDAFSRLEQIAEEAAYVHELAEKYEVPETAIRMTTQNLPSTPISAAAAGSEDLAEEFNPTPIPATAGPDVPPPDAEETPIGPEGETEMSEKRDEIIEVNFAEDTFIPNARMVANAKRALAVREKKPASQRGMTAVGLARARDIANRRELSIETVRRMKAYFDRHEIDKKGETWADQGKGWQAWQGWGGDAGRSWANAIVERVDARQENSAGTPTVTLESPVEVEAGLRKLSAKDWLDAIALMRANPPAEAPKAFDLPVPNVGEKGEDFINRCMANPTMNKEFPENDQRMAVCVRQRDGGK